MVTSRAMESPPSRSLLISHSKSDRILLWRSEVASALSPWPPSNPPSSRSSTASTLVQPISSASLEFPAMDPPLAVTPPVPRHQRLWRRFSRGIFSSARAIKEVEARARSRSRSPVPNAARAAGFVDVGDFGVDSEAGPSLNGEEMHPEGEK